MFGTDKFSKEVGNSGKKVMALLEAYKPVRLRKYLIPLMLVIPELGISNLIIVLKVAQLVSKSLPFIQLGTIVRNAVAKAGSAIVIADDLLENPSKNINNNPKNNFGVEVCFI